MVLWLKKYQKYLFLILFTFITCLNLFTNELYVGHDTLFHLSRIEGLATSISNFDFIPTIYPFKNDFYGYASALFYSDILLYPFSLLYLCNIDIVICFKLCIITYTFIASITSYKLIYHLSQNKYAATLSSLLYLQTTYRLSNIYVRGALGEIMSYAFLPIILLGIYKLFYAKQNSIKDITLGFTLVILSHNITFILACILFLIFIIINLNKLKTTINQILISIILVLCFTSFFTFPLLEQLFSQQFYLETNTNIFFTSDLNIYQLFINQLNFNIAGKSPNNLTLNTGIWLIILPLVNIIYKPDRFCKHCLYISIIFFILILGIIPLQYLSILSIIQFIWRLMTLICVLLIAVSTVNLFKYFKAHKLIFITITSLIILNTLYLLIPCFNQTNVIYNNTEYKSLIDGSIINPYYSAFYVRTELAGADYLPVNGINYAQFKYGLYDSNHQYIHNQINKDYEISFELNKPNNTIIVPKTYYKGYTVYHIDDHKLHKLPTYQDQHTKLVAFDTLDTSGKYIVKYKHTYIQYLSYIISLNSFIYIIYLNYKKKCDI